METTNTRPLRVLLADDDEDDRTFFRDALNELEIKTSLLTVTDGIELTRLLVQNPEPLTHVVFLDLNMPGKTGKDCLREIRTLSHMKHTPVIIFSTSANPRDIEETFLNGASLYIQKPSGFSLMVNLLDKVLRMDWNTHSSRMDRSRFLFS